jgi:hypothetical protein
MAHHDGSHDEAHASAGVGHEERDVTFPPVVAGLIGLAVLGIVSALLMFGFFQFLGARAARLDPPESALAQRYGRQEPPAPRVQPDPLQDLTDMRAEENAVLTTYGWVDRSAGVVRLPVRRAMDLLVQRGLPARPEAKP